MGTALRFLPGRDRANRGGWSSASWRPACYRRAPRSRAGASFQPGRRYLTPAWGYTAGSRDFSVEQSVRGQRIKVFSGAGRSSPSRWNSRSRRGWPTILDRSGRDASAVEAIDYRAAEYVSHLKAILPDVHQLSGMRVAIDCANGATTTVAPRLFQQLGFEVRCSGCEPDGRNINLRCGSTAPDTLAKVVVDGGYRLGIAYDGDGDRAILIDARGRVVDGDAVMLMCAKQRKPKGGSGNAVVATVMSKSVSRIALRDAGIESCAARLATST